MIALFYTLIWVPFVASLFLLGHVMTSGATEVPVISSLFGVDAFALSLTFDTLSVVMLTMIGLLVGVTAQFAFHYLHKQERQSYFFTNFVGLVFGVVLMMTTSNLIYVLASWILQSYFLGKLLMYNSERYQAGLAVKKKYWVSRFADLCLLTAIILLFKSFGTVDFSEMGVLASEPAAQSIIAQLGVFFLCLGALVKAVQFPFHLWLPETMETPAPVSAIMHAGIVNAGGFLLIRTSPMLQHYAPILVFVAFMGAISAVFGSLVMLTQNDIKKKLAYSTISQMGMMMFACGIGAFSIALIHIVAHSLYKAYAFLSTGYLINESQLIPYKPKPWKNQQLYLVAGLGLVFITIAAMLIPNASFSLLLYGSVIGLGLIQCLRAVYDKPNTTSKIPGLVGLMILGGFGFYILVETFFATKAFVFVSMADFASNDSIRYLLASTLVLFLVGFVLNQKLIQSRSSVIRRIYHVLLNGAYIGQISSKMILVNKKGGSHA